MSRPHPKNVRFQGGPIRHERRRHTPPPNAPTAPRKRAIPHNTATIPKPRNAQERRELLQNHSLIATALAIAGSATSTTLADQMVDAVINLPMDRRLQLNHILNNSPDTFLASIGFADLRQRTIQEAPRPATKGVANPTGTGEATEIIRELKGCIKTFIEGVKEASANTTGTSGPGTHPQIIEYLDDTVFMFPELDATMPEEDTMMVATEDVNGEETNVDASLGEVPELIDVGEVDGQGQGQVATAQTA